MELTKAKFTTREIADSLGEKVGAVRTVAFRLFDRGEFEESSSYEVEEEVMEV